MSKYQAYPEYKDTGIDWLPKVPTCWHVLPLKLVLMNKVKDGPHETPVFIEDGIPFLSVDGIQDGKLVFEGCRYISQEDHERYAKKCLPKYGDILLGKAASVGKVAFVDTEQEFNVWSPLAVLTPKSVKYGKFLYYSLQSTWLQAQCDVSSNSNTQKNLSMGVIDNLSFPIPVDSVAEKIANFLDHETAKIDTLIDKQQQLIQLLKEKRQAVISHAVTKGLNPNAPMRDSGVEWLGEVPEHWEMVPLKHLCKFSGGGTPSKDNLSYWTDGHIPWVSPKDMKTFWLSDSQDKLTEKAVQESSTNYVKAGALLMVVRSGILQRTIPIAINTVKITLNQDMKALRFNARMHSEYAANYILGHTPSLLLEWTKEGATVESIEQEYLSNGLVPVPPKQEQLEINNKIKEQMTVFEALESKAVKGIKLLQERRTALISAAVTGKIDVRHPVCHPTGDLQSSKSTVHGDL